MTEKAREQGRFLIVANKSDLPEFKAGEGQIAVSALTGEGIDRLREAIFDTLAPRGELEIQGGFITSVRHESLLQEALAMLEKARGAAQAAIPHELLMLDLYCALHPIDAITGRHNCRRYFEQNLYNILHREIGYSTAVVMNAVQILVADDHEIVRKGLVSILGQKPSGMADRGGGRQRH